MSKEISNCFKIIDRAYIPIVVYSLYVNKLLK